MTALQRFDPYLGWVTYATCPSPEAASRRIASTRRALSDARLRIVAPNETTGETGRR